MAEQSTIHKNMYLVNKETGKVHAYFKKNVNLMSVEEGANESYLSGNIYIDSDHELSLSDLRRMNFSEDYNVLDEVADPDDIAIHEIERPLEYLCSVHYASYKGYKIIDFADRIQLGDDFSNDDFIEAQAFVALLFQKSVGPAEIAKWSSSHWDKYGIVARIEQEFHIVGDDNEDIYNSTYLTNRPQLQSPMEERWAAEVAAKKVAAAEWAKNFVATGKS